MFCEFSVTSLYPLTHVKSLVMVSTLGKRRANVPSHELELLHKESALRKKSEDEILNVEAGKPQLPLNGEGSSSTMQ